MTEATPHRVTPPSTHVGQRAAGRPPHRGRVAARLYRRLLADIMSGRQKPGARMNLLSLADEYGASTNAVRETLIQLTGSGLIVRQAMQGFRVAPATQSDFLELVKTLCWLEETGIRESIANGDAIWEERVLIAHRALSQLAARPIGEADGALMDEHVVTLHDALISACHSSILIDQCRVLHQRLVRYRNLAATVPHEDPAQVQRLLAVRDAALARDADLAVELLRAHYRLGTEAVLASKALP